MRKTSLSVGPSASTASALSTHGVRRTVWYVAAVLLVGLGGLYAWRHRPASPPAEIPPGTRLVSDCTGPIRHWVLGLADRGGVFFDTAQADLIAAADPHIQFEVFYAREKRRADFERALADRGKLVPGRVRWHQASEGVWPWMRDLFLAGSTPAGTPVTLLHRIRRSRARDSAWQPEEIRTIARALGGTSVMTDLWIEGGAVLCDNHRVLVSRHYLEEAVRRGEARDVSAAKDHMATLFGQPVVPLAVGAVHPSNHCDFVMMPAGEGRMVMASPILGAALLAAASSDERARFTAAYRRLALQAPSEHGLAGKQDLPIVDALLARNSRRDIRRAYARLRTQVESLGYTCVEVPLLTLHPRETGVGLTLSYANTVIDERNGRRVVYMPTYGLPSLDRQATGVWRKLGYRVVGIESLWPGLNGGAIHCLSQVFRGSPERSERSER